MLAVRVFVVTNYTQFVRNEIIKHIIKYLGIDAVSFVTVRGKVYELAINKI